MRARALLLLLVVSHVLVFGIAGVANRRLATERATDVATRASDSLTAHLEREAQGLRSVAALVASDPALDDPDPVRTLEARWPYLTVDLLGIERDGRVSALGTVKHPLPAGLGTGPIVFAAEGDIWLLVGEDRPGGRGAVLAGRRIDGPFLEQLRRAIGADLALTVDGALVADAVGDLEGGGALLGLEPGVTSIGGTPYAIGEVAGDRGERWVVATSIDERTPVAAVGVVGAMSLVFAIGVFLTLREAPRVQVPDRQPTPIPQSRVTPGLLAERTRQLSEARERIEMYERYLRRLALELRTALTAVIGYAELLKEDAQRDQRWSAASDVDRILVGARGGLDLVEDTHALTAIERGELSAQPGAFQLGPVLRDVASALRPLGASVATRIVVHEETVGSVYTDRVRLRHVVWNLVGRALHAAPGGLVEVRATREGGEPEEWIRIEVVDNGPSLTPSQLDEIFAVAPKHSSDATGPGSSIGLLVARRFAELLGGTLSAMAASGGGTRLCLRVPARIEADAVDAALAATGLHDNQLEH